MPDSRHAFARTTLTGVGPVLAVAVIALVVALLALIVAFAALVQVARQPVESATPSPTVADAPPTSPTPPVSTSQPNAPQGETFRVPAGRSPIPQSGESIRTPLPAGRLAPLPPPAPPVAAGEVVPWGQAGQYVGQRITAEGTVVNTRNLGRVCFLNFTNDWQGSFYIVIFNEAFADIPGLPQDYYLHQTVRVTGEVRTYQGRPQIQVRDAGQIEIVR